MVFYDVEVREGPAQGLVAEFVHNNPNCCECTQKPVSWISTSLGCTLCEECAGSHRQLGWAVSKLKNIALDEFYEWQMKPLVSSLGNEVSFEQLQSSISPLINRLKGVIPFTTQVINSIWEISIPSGWRKPCPSSSMEEKANFIVGKYRWYGFVDEYSGKDEELANGIVDACIAGNLPQVFWWMSHKSDVNSCKAGRHGRCCLHEAVEKGYVDLVAFLLQNGADIYLKDDRGQTAQDLAEAICSTASEPTASDFRMIISMLLSVQRGEY